LKFILLLFIGAFFISCNEDSIAFDKGLQLDSSLDDITASLTHEITGSCTEGALVKITGEVQEDQTVKCENELYSAEIILEEGDGLKVVRVIQVDENNPLVELNVSFEEIVLDQTPANVSLNTLIPISQSNVNLYRLNGACSDNGQAVNVHLGEVQATTLCSNQVWEVDLNASALNEGVIGVEISHRDFVGNEAPVVQGIVNKDTIAPSLAVSSAPGITFFNASSYDFSGSCSESSDISVSIGGIQISPDPACILGEWSVIGVNVSGLSDGNIDIEVSQIDDFGNQGFGAKQITKLVVLSPPSSLALVAPLFVANSDNTPTFEIGGISSGDIIRLYTSDQCSLVSFVGMNISAGGSVQVTSSSLADGSYSFYATRESGGMTSECSSVNIAYEVTKAFVSTWQTTLADELITLPLRSSGSYDFEVNWGDGSAVERITSETAAHVYGTPGIYIITMRGMADNWSFDNSGDKDKILSVLEFGDMHWVDLSNAFRGASNLGLFNGGDTSNVVNMARMFHTATNVVPDTSGWDTSNVISMFDLFASADNANPDVSNWDVSNVTNMGFMFNQADSANPDVSNWDVSSVTNMEFMFHGADIANPDVTNWNVSSVENFSLMFASTTMADPNVSQWQIVSATNLSGMFQFANAANPDVLDWDTSKVTNMSNLFRDINTNPDVSKWDVRMVSNFRQMFRSTPNADPDVSEWITSSAVDFVGMFQGTDIANPDVLDWDTSKVIEMSNMFSDTLTANPDVSKWNVSSVQRFAGMFSRTRVADPDVSQWVTTSATTLFGMFNRADVANPDVSSWDTSNVTIMVNLFGDADLANPDLSSWDFSKVDRLSEFLTRTSISVTNYSNFLINLSTQTLMNDVQVGASGAGFSAAAIPARDLVITNYNWSFQGDSLE